MIVWKVMEISGDLILAIEYGVRVRGVSIHEPAVAEKRRRWNGSELRVHRDE